MDFEQRRDFYRDMYTGIVTQGLGLECLIRRAASLCCLVLKYKGIKDPDIKGNFFWTLKTLWN